MSQVGLVHRLFRASLASLHLFVRRVHGLPPEAGASITGVAAVCFVLSPLLIRWPGAAGILDCIFPEQAISARADPLDPDAQEIASAIAAATPIERNRVELIVTVMQAKIRYATDEHVWPATAQGRVPSLSEMRARAKEQGWDTLRGDCRHASVLMLSVARALGMHARVSVWRGAQSGHAWVDVRLASGELLSLDSDGHGAGVQVTGRAVGNDEMVRAGQALVALGLVAEDGRLKTAPPMLGKNWGLRLEQVVQLLPVGAILLLASSDARFLLRRALHGKRGNKQRSRAAPHNYSA